MSFARHQTFYLRSGWLTKAIEALNDPKFFSSKEAMVKLGIGKNMVESLRFWVQAAGLAKHISNEKGMELTNFGKLIRDYDIFFELDITWWIIHYYLVTIEKQATSWYYLFNIFPATEFNKNSFTESITRYIDSKVSPSSLQKDYDCIIATYVSPNKVQETPEDNTICPLTKLGLISPLRHNSFCKSSPDKPLPLEVLFLVIKNSSNSSFLNVSSLLREPKNIGKVFNLSLDKIYYYLDLLQEKGWLHFSRTAGIDSLNLSDLNEWELIEQVYNSFNREVIINETK